MRNRPMKNVIVYGGLMLALYAVGRLLVRDRDIPADRNEVSPPCIPPSTCTYKEFTFSLN
jgi:hypothetical protein